MSNSFFQFKEFIIQQDRCGMKVTTDSCLFGAWVAEQEEKAQSIGSNESKVYSVLDIGGGTGLLSLMFAQKNHLAQIEAVELDKEAVEQAKENVATSKWKDRIHIFHEDMNDFTPLHKYDCILSNPPFYENELKPENEKRNLAHHSGVTLTGLFDFIKKHLDPEGSFYILLPYKRQDEIKQILIDHQLHVSELIFVNQTPLHSYFRIMLKGGIKDGNENETLIDEIIIKGEDQQYSAKFKSFLKDYYLHL